MNDLDHIGDYIAKDSIRYAELTVAKLFESPDILETHPLAGKMVRYTPFAMTLFESKSPPLGNDSIPRPLAFIKGIELT